MATCSVRIAVSLAVAVLAGCACERGRAGGEAASPDEPAQRGSSGDDQKSSDGGFVGSGEIRVPGVLEAVWASTGPGAEPPEASDARASGRRGDASDGDARDLDAGELAIEELESRARERELAGRDYPWHDQNREVDGEVECPDVELVEYEGDIVRYNRPIEVNPRFRERLKRFERIVREVALEVYGRPPTTIVQHDNYNCRTVGRDGEKLSEHAFGHAIDIGGFEFEALSGEDVGDLGRASEAFVVRLADHWDAEEGFEARHRRFLRRLVHELLRRGPFSTILGPGYPNHDRFLHLDFGPSFFFRP